MSDGDSLRADVLTEFLEVAINTILYTRNLYPQQIFARRKKYHVPIRVSKHPLVNDYIGHCLRTVRHLLQSDAVRDVSVVIFTDPGNVIERYVFSIGLTVGEVETDDYLVRVEEMFREFILKLTVLDGRLNPLPVGATYSIQIATNEQCYVRLNETPEGGDFPWIEADEDERTNPLHGIIPIKSSDCSLFSLTAYLEA